MPTLVIHAPREKCKRENKKSFESTRASGIGDGYAIYADLFSLLYPGWRVVLLSKDQKLRAEGRLAKLDPADKTENGIQRYDVYVEGFEMVPYKPERLNKCGVSVIDLRK
jgi:hypothetical protein